MCFSLCDNIHSLSSLIIIIVFGKKANWLAYLTYNFFECIKILHVIGEEDRLIRFYLATQTIFKIMLMLSCKT